MQCGSLEMKAYCCVCVCVCVCVFVCALMPTSCFVVAWRWFGTPLHCGDCQLPLKANSSTVLTDYNESNFRFQHGKPHSSGMLLQCQS